MKNSQREVDQVPFTPIPTQPAQDNHEAAEQAAEFEAGYHSAPSFSQFSQNEFGCSASRCKFIGKSFAEIDAHIETEHPENKRLIAMFLAGAKWQKAEDAKELEEKEAACCPEDVGFPEYITALKQRVAELENALGAQGIDYGHAQERMEKNYVSAVNGRKEFRSLAVELRAKLTESEKSRDEALEALGMSSKRNGLLSDRIKQLESEEPSLRAANECNRKCLAQLANAEKREREAVAALESIAMMARVKPTYNDYQLRIDMEDLANAALAAFPSPEGEK